MHSTPATTRASINPMERFPFPRKRSPPYWFVVACVAGRKAGRRGSEAIENLVGPEPLEPMQRLVQRRELLGADAADLLDRPHMLLVERIDDVAHLAAFFGELDAHRSAIDPRALMVR